jgi:hypothetical protein
MKNKWSHLQFKANSAFFTLLFFIYFSINSEVGDQQNYIFQFHGVYKLLGSLKSPLKTWRKSLNFGRALLLLKFLYIYRNFSNSKAGPSIFPILKDLTSYDIKFNPRVEVLYNLKDGK